MFLRHCFIPPVNDGKVKGHKGGRGEVGEGVRIPPSFEEQDRIFGRQTISNDCT